MDGVTPAGRSPSMVAPTGAQVQLPSLQPNVVAALDRAIQAGDPRVFMQLASRAQLDPQQAMEYLRQSVQRSGRPPSEGAQRIATALQQRIQAEQPRGRQPPQAPGQDQPGAGQQPGGGLLDWLLAPFKCLGNLFASLFSRGGNNQQQRPAPPEQSPGRERMQ